MLTGKRAFEGSSPASVIAAIMERPSPSIADVAPVALDRVLKICLAKDPDERWQSARDLKRELEWIADASVEVRTATAPVARRLLPWIVVAVVAVVGVALGTIAYVATRQAPLRPMLRLNAELPADASLMRVNGGSMLALSPDGSRLALTLRGPDGVVRLYTRLLDQVQATPLPGTENAFNPFFSPDGAWIGFFAVGKLKKIAVRGGGAVTLCEARLGAGASWGDDGYIAAALGNTDGIYRVPEEGGTPVPLTKLSPGETTHRFPLVLPGGRAVLFNSANTTSDFRNSSLEAVSIKTGERKVVLRGGISPKYVAAPVRDGYLIYLTGTTLFAARFDPNTLTIKGNSRPVADDVSSRARAGGDFALTTSGTLAYIAGKQEQEGWPISGLDQTGKTELLHAQLGVYSTPRFSPDGKRLAYLKNNGNGEDIWIKEIGSDSQPSRLTFFDGRNNTPIWTPDGRGVVFRSTNQAAPGLYWVPSDGSGQPQRLTDGKLRETARSFSPDGKRLSFERLGNRGSFDIFTAAVEGEPGHPKLGKPEVFLGSPANEAYAVFSPDGRWLAYTSVESGADEVYVGPFPGPGAQWQISTGGGRFPLWSRNELFYQTLEGRVMSAVYSAKGGAFVAGKPRVWTEAYLKLNGNNSTYDLAPDGKRLAAILADDRVGEKLPSHITFLVNFLDELRRGVPAGE